MSYVCLSTQAMMAYYCHCVTENVVCSLFNAFRDNIIHQNHFHCENLEFLWHAPLVACDFARAFLPFNHKLVWLLRPLSLLCSPIYKWLQTIFFSHSVCSAISLHFHLEFCFILNFNPFSQWKLFIIFKG